MNATLLTTQKNAVFTAIQEHKLDPLRFRWTEVSSEKIPSSKVSLLIPDGRPEFFFKFDFQGQFYYPTFSPWENVRNASFGPWTWALCLNHVGPWASLVDQEIEAVDPWQALPDYIAAAKISATPDRENSQFTFSEVERISAGLLQIQKLLIGHTSNYVEQTERIKAEIASLTDSSKRLGRKDWFNLALGSLVTLGIQVALPPEVIRQAFEILKSTVMGIVHLMPQIIAAAPQLA